MADKIKDAQPKKRGRPTKFDQEIAERICAKLAEGKALTTIVDKDGIPCYQTVLRWLANNEDFRAMYARARDEQADTLADEIAAIADERPPIDAFGRTDSAWVSWQRNRIDARKWVAAKLKPRKYGDRLNLDAEVKVTMTPEQRASRIAQLVAKLNGSKPPES